MKISQVDKLLAEIKKYDQIAVVGKGPTAQHLSLTPNTFYVGIKQGIIFLPRIDLMVLTDLSGFYCILHLLKNIKYILCPFFLHDWQEKVNKHLNHKFIEKYVRENGFTGVICFVQIQSDLNKDKKNLTIYKVPNSGYLFFSVCQPSIVGKSITTYGINKYPGYHPDIIRLIEGINIKECDQDQKKWIDKFFDRLKRKHMGQMINPKVFEGSKKNYHKFENLNITFS